MLHRKVYAHSFNTSTMNTLCECLFSDKSVTIVTAIKTRPRLAKFARPETLHSSQHLTRLNPGSFRIELGDRNQYACRIDQGELTAMACEFRAHVVDQ